MNINFKEKKRTNQSTGQEFTEVSGFVTAQKLREFLDQSQNMIVFKLKDSQYDGAKHYLKLESFQGSDSNHSSNQKPSGFAEPPKG